MLSATACLTSAVSSGCILLLLLEGLNKAPTPPFPLAADFTASTSALDFLRGKLKALLNLSAGEAVRSFAFDRGIDSVSTGSTICGMLVLLLSLSAFVDGYSASSAVMTGIVCD